MAPPPPPDMNSTRRGNTPESATAWMGGPLAARQQARQAKNEGVAKKGNKAEGKRRSEVRARQGLDPGSW